MSDKLHPQSQDLIETLGQDQIGNIYRVTPYYRGGLSTPSGYASGSFYPDTKDIVLELPFASTIIHEWAHANGIIHNLFRNNPEKPVSQQLLADLAELSIICIKDKVYLNSYHKYRIESVSEYDVFFYSILYDLKENNPKQNPGRAGKIKEYRLYRTNILNNPHGMVMRETEAILIETLISDPNKYRQFISSVESYEPTFNVDEFTKRLLSEMLAESGSSLGNLNIDQSIELLRKKYRQQRIPSAITAARQTLAILRLTLEKGYKKQLENGLKIEILSDNFYDRLSNEILAGNQERAIDMVQSIIQAKPWMREHLYPQFINYREKVTGSRDAALDGVSGFALTHLMIPAEMES